jgi:hypothetical protein
VGAILRFFARPPEDSSCSLSLASLLVPVVKLVELRGVSGGVVMGTPVTLPEFVAVILGTCPAISGGLLRTPVCVVEDCVSTEHVEFDRVGEDGRGFTKVAVGGGEGAVIEPDEFRC